MALVQWCCGFVSSLTTIQHKLSEERGEGVMAMKGEEAAQVYPAKIMTERERSTSFALYHYRS